MRARPDDSPYLHHHPSQPRLRQFHVIHDADTFYGAFANDLVNRIVTSADNGDDFVAILPVGPVPQYTIAAQLINERRISLRHVHTFNMDEYADEDGNTAPTSWVGSFQRAMWENFLGRIDAELRPPEKQIMFPTTEVIDSYSTRIEDLGGADVCYGGIGWAGHIAFWEPHLGLEFAGDLAAYRSAGARLVELHPMTVMQNALHSFGGDWSCCRRRNTLPSRDRRREAPQLLARWRPWRRIPAVVHLLACRARPGFGVRPRQHPAGDSATP